MMDMKTGTASEEKKGRNGMKTAQAKFICDSISNIINTAREYKQTAKAQKKGYNECNI